MPLRADGPDSYISPEERKAIAREHAKAKKKKAVVKKKAPPIPVPSLQAGWEIDNAPAKPGPSRARTQPTMMDVKKKPAPHGGHKPVRYLYTPIEDFLLPPEKGSKRDLEIRKYNQRKERNRRLLAARARVATKAERDERRRVLRDLPADHRKIVLDGQSAADFIRNGPKGPGLIDRGLGAVRDAYAEGVDVEGLLRAIDEGAADFGRWMAEPVTRDIKTYREKGLVHGTIASIDALEDDLNEAGNVVFGKDLQKVVGGDIEGADMRLALVEAALLGVPIKGLPTVLSVGLRNALGAARFTKLLRSGGTVADALKQAEWTKPVLTARAQHRAALRRADAPRASSYLAGKIAGEGDGRIRSFIRNDPSEQRTFTIKTDDRQLDVTTPADLSRTGKIVRRGLDRYRGGWLGKVPGITSEEKMVDKVLAQRAETLMNKYAGVQQAVKLPRNALGQIDWAGVYAVRTVLKNVDIGDAINRTARDLAEAEAKGDALGARALMHHLNYFKAAFQYVERTADGLPKLKDDAPANLQELKASIESATDAREQILMDMDLLTESRARERVLKEQKFYQGATHQPRNDFIQQAIVAHPVREQARAILAQHHPASVKGAMAVLDGMARTFYENLHREGIEKVEDLRHLLLQDTDEVTLGARYMALRRLQQDVENLSPATFYDHFSGVQDYLPPEVVRELTSEYGAQGGDWLFRLQDLMDDGGEFAQRISDEIHASGLPLPPELDTPEKLAAGIDNVFELAREGAAGKDWYPEAAAGVTLVAEHTGVPPKQVAQLFAIFSQAADTVANSTFVFDAIRQFQLHGDLFSGRFPVRQSEEALAVLRGGKWEGRKRSSFYANILRHIPGMEEEYAAVLKEMAELRGSETNPVTVDRWVVRMFAESLGDVPGKYYDTFEKIIQRMADEWGWQPEQIQAAAWVAMKDRGLQAEAAKGGRRTARHVAGAEDAFQYGIRRQIEKEAEAEAQGGLFAVEKYAVTPAAKRLASKVNKKWGGFTVDRGLKPVPEEGYSVTLSLTETEYPLHKIKPQDIEQFRERYRELLKDKRLKIGGFSDDQNDVGDGTDVSYLSITRHFKRKADAMKFAREQGQETVYEYKTGDGIRTGLSREEQAAIIQGLRDAEAIPRAFHADPLPTDAMREYDRLLGRLSAEFGNTKAGKVATASQKARTEEWLLKHGHEYPDEPSIKEWEAAYDARPRPEEPDWMKGDSESFRMRASGAPGTQGIPPGLVDEALGAKGEELAKAVRGYATAVKQLDRADIPTEFIKRVWNDPDMHLYDKMKIGAHLNRLSGGGLRDRKFPDIPGAHRMFDVAIAGGFYLPAERLVVQSPRGKGIDMLHEFFHGAENQKLLPEGLLGDMLEYVGAARGARPQDVTDHQAEDMADMFEAMILGFNPKESKLPKPLRAKMEKLSKSMRAGRQGTTKRAQAMLDRMPPELRQNMEDMLWYDKVAGKRKGMYGHGPNYVHREGGRYVPESQGLPFSFSERLLGPRRYGTLYNRLKEGRRVQTLTPTDQALENEFTGRLLASGRWSRDVTAGPLHGLIKAMEIEKMAYLRANILDATFDTPKGMKIEDVVAIPEDPKAFAESQRGGQDLADLFALFDVMDSGLPVHAQHLDRVTVNGIEQAKDFFFPGYRDPQQIEDLIKQAAEKPIPGIRWISRQHLDRTGVLSPPGLNAIIKRTKWATNLQLDHALAVADDANNILKLLTLSLNPSYYTMNLTGQGVMLLMQQGAFAPVSLGRSLIALRGLHPETRAILGAHAGIGQASIIQAQGGVAKGAVDLTQRFANAVIDKHPRMAAIIYEARRLGYKTDAELEDLITNPANAEDLFTASRRANRAMVDFQNLSYAEREFVGRLVFVYPWLRASAKWAAQYPFDHPIQAAALAGLLYWQQQRLKESFPEGHPGYLKWYFPIEGGEDPYGFRLDQAFTPLQPLDLASELAWLISGESLPWGANEEAAVGRFNPLVEEIFTAITGYDAFAQEEVQRSLLGFFRRMVDPGERYASWNRISKALKGETHEGLYDTNQTQNWLRVILGSLAPVDIDADVAADMAAPTRTVRVPEVSDEEAERRFMNQVEERARAEGVQIPAELSAQYKAWQEYNDQEAAFKREHDLDSLKPQERLAVLLLTWGEVNGRQADAEARVEKALAMSEEEAEDAIEEGREALGISRIDRIKRRLSEGATADREVVDDG